MGLQNTKWQFFRKRVSGFFLLNFSNLWRPPLNKTAYPRRYFQEINGMDTQGPKREMSILSKPVLSVELILLSFCIQLSKNRLVPEVE
jgi:hypothetical protein